MNTDTFIIVLQIMSHSHTCGIYMMDNNRHSHLVSGTDYSRYLITVKCVAIYVSTNTNVDKLSFFLVLSYYNDYTSVAK